MERRDCLKKIWPEICAEANKIRKANQTVAVTARDAEHALYVVGQPKTVKKVHQQIDQMCREMEEKLEHMKDTINISAVEKALIEKVDLVEKLNKGRPKLKLSLRPDGIMFEGPPRDLLDSQKELNTFLRTVQRNELKMSPGQLKVLKMLRRQTQNPVHAAMNQYEAVIHNEDQNTTVIAGTPRDVNKCHEILAELIKETKITVAEDERNACFGSSWDKFANDLFMNYKGNIHVESLGNRNHPTINVVAHSEVLPGVLEDITNHIKKHAIKKERLVLSRAETRMIDQWMAGDLREIEENFKAHGIKIEALFQGFQIKGTQDGLQPASARIKQLTEKILHGTHTVSTPGMPYYFTQVEIGKSFIRMREEKYHVIIHYGDPEEEEEPAGEGAARAKSQETREAGGGLTEMHQATHAPTGVIIRVFVGDMTKHKVDAIVNAANTDLKHIGGLAKAIADKGNAYVESHLFSLNKNCNFVKYLR